jgi:hypothetical protein
MMGKGGPNAAFQGVCKEKEPKRNRNTRRERLQRALRLPMAQSSHRSHRGQPLFYYPLLKWQSSLLGRCIRLLTPASGQLPAALGGSAASAPLLITKGSLRNQRSRESLPAASAGLKILPLPAELQRFCSFEGARSFVVSWRPQCGHPACSTRFSRLLRGLTSACWVLWTAGVILDALCFGFVLNVKPCRSQTIALNEYVRFMKANNYQKLGLMLTDLTDAFKFANQATDDSDKNEMTESEFAQCLLFTQARYMARKAPEANILTGINRPPFDLSSNVAAQLGPFFVALCGSKLIVQGGSSGKQITEVFLRTPLPSRPSSAEDGASGAEVEDGGVPTRHIPDDDEEENAKPITQREMNAFIQEMRQIFTRLSKRTKANRYLERVIAASKGGLNPMPSKSEQDMRNRLTIEFRSVRLCPPPRAAASLQALPRPCALRAFCFVLDQDQQHCTELPYTTWAR